MTDKHETSPLGSAGRVISFTDKSFPARTFGLTIAQLRDAQISLAEFSTPLVAIDEAALEHNLATMAQWLAQRGLQHMPHGKTSMAPALWRKHLEHGAIGLTFATPWQAQLGLEAGVRFVQLANQAVDLGGVARLRALLDQRPEQRLVTWVDSVAAVERLVEVLGVGERPFEVLVELGADGGRTGARGLADAIAVVEAVHQAPALHLAGVAGYEGALGHDRSPEALARVERYLADLRGLFAYVRTVQPEGELILTAGGSAYYDLVAEAFEPLHHPDNLLVVRAGAYLTHDDGFYRSISPLDHGAADDEPARLRPALRAYAAVVSTPERGLALLDAGKRDLPFDEGLPVPIARSQRIGVSEHPTSAEVTALNDQHTFVRWNRAEPDALRVGDVVRLGISHPCTTFDKWRLIPVVDFTTGIVVDAVETYF